MLRYLRSQAILRLGIPRPLILSPKSIHGESIITPSSSSSSALLSVMSFGDGSQGALGTPGMIGAADAYEPTRVSALPVDVRSVSAGHYHSMAVTGQGEVWAWGRNDEGQLGRGTGASRDSWSEPKRVEGLSHVNVGAAFGSGVTSVALGEDGSLWVWGRSKRGQLGLGNGITQALVPSRVEKLAGELITKVALGWGHALAQTADGKLFGWGYSADGRLGQLATSLVSSPLDLIPNMDRLTTQHTDCALDAAEKFVLESMEKENNMPIVWEPRLFEELNSVEVIDIACGLDHSLILCRDGTLLSGGSNTYGQLGRSRTDLGLLPVDMSFRPVSIASGLGHSMAICENLSSRGNEIDRQVVSWGWNHNSQLGRTGSESIPSSVEGFYEETPVSLSGGRVHSLAVTSVGNLWAWGCGKHGRLGLGSSLDEPEPMPVDIQGYRVLQAVSGFDHNLLLVAKL